MKEFPLPAKGSAEDSRLRALAAVSRISAVPAMLRIVCQTTGMGFAAVARVTDDDWTACAVEDRIAFGLPVGGQLDVHTTLCKESRTARRPIVVDHASEDAVYRAHHTPRLYNIESYISVPIVLSDGSYFGNLCAIDPHPTHVSDARTLSMFEHFAELIALQLEGERRRDEVETALMSERANSELREHFVAVLGHDLRNPLNAVAMAAQVLVRRSEPELSKLGQRLVNSSRRMSNLIDDVLDLARTRLGPGIALKRASHDNLGSLLEDVVTELRVAHPDRELRSRIVVDVPVACDAGRLQQLLSNLLGNAVAYGASDQPVEVNVQIEGAWLVLSVANQGEPIPAELQARVFEPYWRPVSSTLGGGLGLGLYICAEIVKAHGGQLTLESSAGHGTRFTARLPLA